VVEERHVRQKHRSARELRVAVGHTNEKEHDLFEPFTRRAQHNALLLYSPGVVCPLLLGIVRLFVLVLFGLVLSRLVVRRKCYTFS
jgi:hypothetical protein